MSANEVNVAFTILMIETFTVAERMAWGSDFAKAERAGWIQRDLDAAVMHR